MTAASRCDSVFVPELVGKLINQTFPQLFDRDPFLRPIFWFVLNLQYIIWHFRASWRDVPWSGGDVLTNLVVEDQSWFSSHHIFYFLEQYVLNSFGLCLLFRRAGTGFSQVYDLSERKLCHLGLFEGVGSVFFHALLREAATAKAKAR